LSGCRTLLSVPKGAVKSLPGKNPGWGKLTGGAQKLGPGK